MKSNFSIVIADDDMDDHLLLIKAIQKIHPSPCITSVYDGVMLMELLKKTMPIQSALPDLVILDLNMPRMDGYEVLKTIKSKKDFKHIPVFIVTTCTYEYDKIKSIAYGASNFYSKPSDFSDLVKIMEEIFSQATAPSLTTTVLT